MYWGFESWLGLVINRYPLGAPPAFRAQLYKRETLNHNRGWNSRWFDFLENFIKEQISLNNLILPPKF